MSYPITIGDVRLIRTLCGTPTSYASVNAAYHGGADYVAITHDDEGLQRCYLVPMAAYLGNARLYEHGYAQGYYQIAAAKIADAFAAYEISKTKGI